MKSKIHLPGEHLNPVVVSKSKVKIKTKKQGSPNDSSTSSLPLPKDNISDLISPKQMAIEGLKAQSEMVIDNFDRLITTWQERNVTSRFSDSSKRNFITINYSVKI